MKEPILLAPMKALVGRQKASALSTSTMRSILDSIATRLDESRDILRYLTGLLVFLGLLGTFWGLLQTIGPPLATPIAALDPQGGDANSMLDALKTGLSAPLAGMSTAFSSSLARPVRIADPRFSRPAGRPRPEPLLHRTRKLALDRDRPRPGATGPGPPPGNDR